MSLNNMVDLSNVHEDDVFSALNRMVERFKKDHELNKRNYSEDYQEVMPFDAWCDDLLYVFNEEILVNELLKGED